VFKNFDLRPGMIVKQFDLKRPIYKKLAAFGHFGRTESEFLWEKVKDLSHEKKWERSIINTNLGNLIYIFVMVDYLLL